MTIKKRSPKKSGLHSQELLTKHMENNFFVSFSITNIQQQTAPGLRVEKYTIILENEGIYGIKLTHKHNNSKKHSKYPKMWINTEGYSLGNQRKISSFIGLECK